MLTIFYSALKDIKLHSAILSNFNSDLVQILVEGSRFRKNKKRFTGFADELQSYSCKFIKEYSGDFSFY